MGEKKSRQEVMIRREYIIDFGPLQKFLEFKSVYNDFMKLACREEPSGIDGIILRTGVSYLVPGELSDAEEIEYNISNNYYMVALIDHDVEERAHKAAEKLGVRLIKLN